MAASEWVGTFSNRNSLVFSLAAKSHGLLMQDERQVALHAACFVGRQSFLGEQVE